MGEISRTLRVQRRLPGFVLRDFLDRVLLATLAVRSSSFWNLYVTFGGDRTGLVSENFTLERARERQKKMRVIKRERIRADANAESASLRRKRANHAFERETITAFKVNLR